MGGKQVAEEESSTDVREIAGAIVASYVENNQMPADQVPGFIQNVMQALRTGGGEGTAAPAEALKPAVPVRKSVTPDAVTCLVCGQSLKTLKRHIRTAHGMSEQEYREAFNLPRSHPLVSPNYSKQRTEMAKRIGLGRKAGGGARRGKKG